MVPFTRETFGAKMNLCSLTLDAGVLYALVL